MPTTLVLVCAFKILERFLLVMGSEGPGLAVKKCRRGKNVNGGAEVSPTGYLQRTTLRSLPYLFPYVFSDAIRLLRCD